MRVAIHELAEIRTGYQVKEGIQPDPDGNCLVIQAKDIDEGNGHELVVNDLDKINILRDPAPYMVRDGDVIFLSRGRRRFATLAERLPNELPSIALYYFFILRLNTERVLPSFLVWAINESEAQEYLERETSGTAMPFLTKKNFSRLTIELPSLATQEKVGNLYRLMILESRLRRELEQRRSELVRTICQKLCNDDGNGVL